MIYENIAVILAAGSGSRFGAEIPKQYLQVNGRYILSYSLETFASHPNISSIAVVYSPQHEQFMKSACAQHTYDKPVYFIRGGKKRYDSTKAALDFFQQECCLLFHDAARPLVSHDIISACITSLSSYSAAGTAVPSSDTIFFSENGRHISSVLPRPCLYNAQTPQCFRRSVLNEAYTKAFADTAFTATDDCGIISKYLPDIPIAIVPGSSLNFKITYPADLQFFEQVLKERT